MHQIMHNVTLITTGGTIEKTYDEATGRLENRRSIVRRMLPQTSISQESAPPTEYWLALLVTLPLWFVVVMIAPPPRSVPVPVCCVLPVAVIDG